MRERIFWSIGLLAAVACALHIFHVHTFMWWSYVSLAAVLVLINRNIWIAQDDFQTALKYASDDPLDRKRRSQAKELGDEYADLEASFFRGLILFAGLFAILILSNNAVEQYMPTSPVLLALAGLAWPFIVVIGILIALSLM